MLVFVGGAAVASMIILGRQAVEAQAPHSKTSGNVFRPQQEETDSPVTNLLGGNNNAPRPTYQDKLAPLFTAPGPSGTVNSDRSSRKRGPIDLTRKQRIGLQEAIRRTPGAATLIVSEVWKELQLTEEQRKKIQSIVDMTRDALKSAEQRYAVSGSREEYSQLENQVYAAAREEALQLLTDRQRERWNSLAGQGTRKDK